MLYLEAGDNVAAGTESLKKGEGLVLERGRFLTMIGIGSQSVNLVSMKSRIQAFPPQIITYQKTPSQTCPGLAS